MNNSIENLKRIAKHARILLAATACIAFGGARAVAHSAPQHQHKSQSQTAPTPNATPTPGTTPATTPASQAAARASAEAAAAKLKAPANAGDFYIVSSISSAQKQIVLKLPTEVTQLVQTNAQTQFLDEQGKPLALKDLRAGDTVFVVLQKTASGGTPVVQRLQRGGMTVNELHKKYLSGS